MNNKSLFNPKIFLLLNLIFLCLLASCFTEMPIKEMSLAKANLTRAVEVRSEKYAPDEYKTAKDELLKSHDHVKADKKKESKTAAENSIKYSDQAIAKSLPLLAEDNLNEANTIFSEAAKAYAEEYAKEDYSFANDKIGESDDLLRVDQYWESYLKSNEAIIYAKSARDKALSNVDALKKRIQNIKDKKDELSSLDEAGIASEDLKSIDESVVKAASMIEEKDLKAAVPVISGAEKILEGASLKIWASLADSKLKLAENALKEADNSPKKKSFSKEIENARGLIGESKGFYDDQSWDDSISKSEQAIEILNSVTVAIESMREEKKIDEEKKLVESGNNVIREYVVKLNPKARDCLWRIAHNVYKDAKLWPLIYVANRDQIKDPDLIFPGQKFVIPDIPGKNDSKETEIKENNNGTETVPTTQEKTEINKTEVIEPGTTGADNEVIEDTNTDNENDMNLNNDSGQNEDVIIEEGNPDNNEVKEE